MLIYIVKCKLFLSAFSVFILVRVANSNNINKSSLQNNLALDCRHTTSTVLRLLYLLTLKNLAYRTTHRVANLQQYLVLRLLSLLTLINLTFRTTWFIECCHTIYTVLRVLSLITSTISVNIAAFTNISESSLQNNLAQRVLPLQTASRELLGVVFREHVKLLDHLMEEWSCVCVQVWGLC